MKNLTSPLIGLLFLQRNSTILDMRQGILNFPFFSMQLKNEDRTYPNVIECILNPVETIAPLPPATFKTAKLFLGEVSVSSITTISASLLWGRSG